MGCTRYKTLYTVKTLLKTLSTAQWDELAQEVRQLTAAEGALRRVEAGGGELAAAEHAAGNAVRRPNIHCYFFT